MTYYQTEYNIPGIHLKLEKDLSDSIKEFGSRSVQEIIYPLLTKALLGVSKTFPK